MFESMFNSGVLDPAMSDRVSNGNFFRNCYRLPKLSGFPGIFAIFYFQERVPTRPVLTSGSRTLLLILEYRIIIILPRFRYKHTNSYMIPLREHEYKYFPILATNSPTYVSNFEVLSSLLSK